MLCRGGQVQSGVEVSALQPSMSEQPKLHTCSRGFSCILGTQVGAVALLAQLQPMIGTETELVLLRGGVVGVRSRRWERGEVEHQDSTHERADRQSATPARRLSSPPADGTACSGSQRLGRESHESPKSPSAGDGEGE